VIADNHFHVKQIGDFLRKLKNSFESDEKQQYNYENFCCFSCNLRKNSLSLQRVFHGI
jgi:hypothetical protein